MYACLFQLSENTNVDTDVVTVIANDADSGVDGMVTYSIEGTVQSARRLYPYLSGICMSLDIFAWIFCGISEELA